MSKEKEQKWLRLYMKLMDDEDVMGLTDAEFKTWVCCLLTTKANGGILPPDKTVAFKVRKPESVVRKHIQTLVEIGLISNIEGELQPTGWMKLQYETVVSTSRVKRFRERQRNGDETLVKRSMKRCETVDETLVKRSETVHETVVKRPQRLEYRDNTLSPLPPAENETDPEAEFSDLARDLCEGLPLGGDFAQTKAAIQFEFQKSASFAGEPIRFAQSIQNRLMLWRAAYSADHRLKPKPAQWWLRDGVYALNPPEPQAKRTGRFELVEDDNATR